VQQDSFSLLVERAKDATYTGIINAIVTMPNFGIVSRVIEGEIATKTKGNEQTSRLSTVMELLRKQSHSSKPFGRDESVKLENNLKDFVVAACAGKKEAEMRHVRQIVQGVTADCVAQRALAMAHVNEVFSELGDMCKKKAAPTDVQGLEQSARSRLAETLARMRQARLQEKNSVAAKAIADSFPEADEIVDQLREGGRCVFEVTTLDAVVQKASDGKGRTQGICVDRNGPSGGLAATPPSPPGNHPKPLII
jgi:hypothetical protein